MDGWRDDWMDRRVARRTGEWGGKVEVSGLDGWMDRWEDHWMDRRVARGTCEWGRKAG